MKNVIVLLLIIILCGCASSVSFYDTWEGYTESVSLDGQEHEPVEVVGLRLSDTRKIDYSGVGNMYDYKKNPVVLVDDDFLPIDKKYLNKKVRVTGKCGGFPIYSDRDKRHSLIHYDDPIIKPVEHLSKEGKVSKESVLMRNAVIIVDEIEIINN